MGAGVVLTGGPIGRGRVVVAGVLVGLALLFRIDFGLCGILACITFLTWESYRTTSIAPAPQAVFRRAADFLLAAGVIAIPVYGALMIRGVRAVIDNLLVYPAQAMPYRKIPLSLQELDVLLLPAATLILALGALRPTVGRWLFGRSSGGIVFMASLAVLAAPYSLLGRCDFLHLFSLYCVCCALFPVLLGAHLGGSPRSQRVARSIVAGAGLVVALLFVERTLEYRSASRIKHPRTVGIVSNGGGYASLFQAVEDLNEINPGSPIFVGCDRHDLLLYNCPILYFLSARPIGTYWATFDPGLITSAPIQERVIRDLERCGVDTVVLFRCPPRMSRIRVTTRATFCSLTTISRITSRGSGGTASISSYGARQGARPSMAKSEGH